MTKKVIISLIFLLGILLPAQTTFAQANDKTKRQVYINGKGEVLDGETKLGYISKEDIIYNNQGKKLGFIKNGAVFDAEGNSLGKAKKGGQYYNKNGEFVLYVKGDDEKCEVLDHKGNAIGYVHKNYKLHACATHCFFGENKIEDDMDAILSGYMGIENALADDNSKSAQKAATELLYKATALNESYLKKTLEALSKTMEINQQRNHFETLSNQLYAVLKETNLRGKTLYWNYCPMAMDGKGANWLSLTEKTNNPYLGSKMPDCGTTKETLK
ncbi:DUF3347 domain-containing protein [Mariniflexile sp.]|uniref:DUF3347 domain-containing protein n=1 Tax=Mariniflexile sp. TaxID=1979402 RepID=UPI004048E16D